MPSAFVYSRDDELFNDTWSRWICRRMLQVEPVELPGGHFPMLEHPELLADALETVAAQLRHVLDEYDAAAAAR